MTTPGSPLEAWPAGALEPETGRPRMRSRWIVPPPSDRRWTGAVLSEWDLSRAGWEDRHPHDETTVVLQGRLLVEAGGEVVDLGPGDCAVVRAGETGRYWTTTYARMLAVYGPNPTGAATTHERYWEIDDDLA